MVWPFSSGTSTPPRRRGQLPSEHSQELEAPPEIPPTLPSHEPPEPIKALSREEQANLDLENVLKEINAEEAQIPPDLRPKYNPVTRTTTYPKLPSTETSSLPEPQDKDISPSALYPTTLSCRSALDYAMFCQSFGGQFVNVYRYGTFRSCSNHWSDFWLCMKTRSWDEKDKSKAIYDHYKEKAIKWKKGPSSEDVWKIRTEPVENAFQGDLEALEAEVEQWKVQNPDQPDPWLSAQKTTFAQAQSAKEDAK